MAVYTRINQNDLSLIEKNFISACVIAKQLHQTFCIVGPSVELSPITGVYNQQIFDVQRFGLQKQGMKLRIIKIKTTPKIDICCFIAHPYRKKTVHFHYQSNSGTKIRVWCQKK